MDDRDTFAAAALTGLLVRWQSRIPSDIGEVAYKCADAMLRERGTAFSDNCVLGNQREMACPVTKALPKEKRAEVSDTFTAEERDAVEWAADNLDACGHGSATLRKLLERLK